VRGHRPSHCLVIEGQDRPPIRRESPAGASGRHGLVWFFGRATNDGAAACRQTGCHPHSIRMQRTSRISFFRIARKMKNILLALYPCDQIRFHVISMVKRGWRDWIYLRAMFVYI